MVHIKNNPYLQAIEHIGVVGKRLTGVSSDITNTAREIRIRIGREVSLFTGSENRITDGRTVSKDEMEDCFRNLCGFSIHSYQRELAAGFITITGGHRAGICGTAVVKNGEIESIKDISGINIRIAREITGCSAEITQKLFDNNLPGILIIGVPGSGKTTILRDLCRYLGGSRKVSLIDERGEIAAMHKGVPQNDIGLFTDVFDGYPKSKGILSAIRVMSPDVVICDELGDIEDGQAVYSCMNAGVSIIATAHANSVEQAYMRPVIKSVLSSGAVDYIVVLRGEETGKIQKIHKVQRGINNA